MKNRRTDAPGRKSKDLAGQPVAERPCVPSAWLALALASILLASCASRSGPDQVSQAVPPVDRAPDIPELRVAWKQAKILHLSAPDGVRIPVRSYGTGGSGRPVIMTHGLQSHSGWFAQSARFMAGRQHPVYALDRRGSGLSTERRGDMSSFGEMTDDIATVVKYAMKKHGVGSVHVVGHCFGAIPSTVFACQYPHLVDTLILPTPGLFTHTDLKFTEKLSVASAQLVRRTTYLPIPLEPNMFADDPAYQSFVTSDPLTLREASAATFYATDKARTYIKRHREALTMPVFMALAQRDVICDNEADMAFFESLPARPKRVRTYDARHILEYGKGRGPFFSDLGTWMKEAERRN
jgi:pimeloyl-ACP methyl ester carboxylesterase